MVVQGEVGQIFGVIGHTLRALSDIYFIIRVIYKTYIIKKKPYDLDLFRFYMFNRIDLKPFLFSSNNIVSNFFL